MLTHNTTSLTDDDKTKLISDLTYTISNLLKKSQKRRFAHMRTETIDYNCFENDKELLNTLENICAEHENENLHIQTMNGLSEAVIGISGDKRLIYSYAKILHIFMTRDNMTEEEAIEWIEYNVIRSIPYFKPEVIIMYDVK